MTRRRKLIAAVVALALAVLLLPLFAAFEAHVINVTAHIENALKVSTLRIDFGTVFPEEVLVETFTVSFSDSFLEQDRVTDVHYSIAQKEKPWDPASGETTPNVGTPMEGRYYDLRPYLEKKKIEVDTPQDTETAASLNRETGDLSDIWRVRLRVPDIQGAVGQDYAWLIAPAEGDYGADIWIEVGGFSYGGTVFDMVIDANGYGVDRPGQIAWHGIPIAVNVAPGNLLTNFGPTPAGGSGVDMFDRDGNGVWTVGDDLMTESPRFGGNRNGVYDLGVDKPILDLNGSFVNGEGVSFDLDAFGLVLGIKYYDANGNGDWDNGEDIVLDGNGNGIFD